MRTPGADGDSGWSGKAAAIAEIPLPGALAGLIAAFASVLLAACGDRSTGTDRPDSHPSSLQPAPDASPVHLRRGVVATVAGGEVTRAEFGRVYTARARNVRRGTGGRGARAGAEGRRRSRHRALVRSAMSEAILAEAVAQRARAAGVSVSGAQVDAALEGLRERFESAARWRGFLRRTGQTEPEVRARLRLELLNRRLYDRRLAPESGDGAGSALAARRRLRAATACRPGFVVALCSNSPSGPAEVVR